MSAPLVGNHDLRTPYWAQFHEQVATAGVRAVARSAPRIITTFASWAWRTSPRLTACTVALQLLAALATTFGLLASAEVFARLLADGPTVGRVVSALPALVLIATAVAARGLLQAGAGAAQATLTPRIEQRAQDDLYLALAQVDLIAFDDADLVGLVERASRHGLVAVRQGMTLLAALLSAAVSVVAAVVATTVLHPVLALVVVLTAVPQGWSSLRAAQLQMASFARTASQERRRDVTGGLLSERRNAAEIRAFTAERVLIDEHMRITAELTAEATRVGRRLTVLLGTGRAVSAACGLVGYTVLGALVYTDRLPLALAGTAVVAMRASAPATSAGVLTVNRMFEAGLYIRLYRDCVDDLRRRRRHTAVDRCVDGPDVVELADVSFRYPAASQDAVRHVDLTLRRGEVVALVGENGSGKTTLAKIIAGLYLPTAGTASWDGVPTADVAPARLHDRIAVVFQDPVRWPFSAGNNVRIGRLERADPDGSAFDDAIRRSGADSVFLDLPQGPDTILSRAFQDGRDLSGGQWQRIGVARGLYRDATLIVADEPTAALDARAEDAVFTALRAMAADREDGVSRTMVLVTHRLANVRHADRIVVLDKGRIVEQGTHRQLLDLGGVYHHLFTLQARSYSG